MHTKLIRIGNSRGVRIPAAVIEQARLREDLDIEVRGETVLIRAARRSREGWAEAAAACHRDGADNLPDWDATSGDHWA